MSCKQGLKTITLQITEILQRIDPVDYQQALEVFNGSSIGQHFRHILDFYQCLVRGAESGVVDYANRERNPDIETDPRFAAKAFSNAMERIEALDPYTHVFLRADFMHTEDLNRPLFPSSYGRELTFVHDHAIHHMAMIKIGIQEQCPYILHQEDFGVAPSTIKFRMGQ